MTKEIILWVASTNFLLLVSCIFFFKKLLKKLLKQQREELEQACENRIGELQHYYNHYGARPILASLRGMLGLTSLGIGIRIDSLRKSLKKQDWNTQFDIEELCNIKDQEIDKAIGLADALDEEYKRRLATFKYSK